MRPPGVPEVRAIIDRVLAAPADGTAGGGGVEPHTPGQQADGRGRQLEESWLALLNELREPVETALRGGLSAGDIAYRLGELVHNYFRTRGVTLASFELRRIVVALLENYRAGWPVPPPARRSEPASVPEPSAATSDSLVAFVDGNGRRARPPAGSWNGEAPAVPPSPVVTPDLPSALVSLEPRPGPVPAPAPEAVAPRPEVTPVVLPEAPREPQPRRQAEVAREAATLGAEAALAAILPVLQSQRGAAPALSAGRSAVAGWLASAVDAALASTAITVSDPQKDRLVGLAFDELFGLGPLEDPLRDRSVSAILVNGPRSVFFDRHGRLEAATATFRDAVQLDDVARRLILRAGDTAVFEHELLIDRQLDDGTRVTIVGPPLAPSGPYLVIRRPAARAASLDSLVAEGTLSAPMADLLRLAVRSRANVLVCGAAGSGKAALLAALLGAATAEDRVVTLEGGAASWPDLPNHVRLTVAEDAGVSPAQALAAAVALRPDRLVVADVA